MRASHPPLLRPASVETPPREPPPARGRRGMEEIILAFLGGFVEQAPRQTMEPGHYRDFLP